LLAALTTSNFEISGLSVDRRDAEALPEFTHGRLMIVMFRIITKPTLFSAANKSLRRHWTNQDEADVWESKTGVYRQDGNDAKLGNTLFPIILPRARSASQAHPGKQIRAQDSVRTPSPSAKTIRNEYFGFSLAKTALQIVG
jgi:hypothetical protein